MRLSDERICFVLHIHYMYCMYIYIYMGSVYVSMCLFSLHFGSLVVSSVRPHKHTPMVLSH